MIITRRVSEGRRREDLKSVVTSSLTYVSGCDRTKKRNFKLLERGTQEGRRRMRRKSILRLRFGLGWAPRHKFMTRERGAQEGRPQKRCNFLPPSLTFRVVIEPKSATLYCLSEGRRREGVACDVNPSFAYASGWDGLQGASSRRVSEGRRRKDLDRVANLSLIFVCRVETARTCSFTKLISGSFTISAVASRFLGAALGCLCHSFRPGTR
jgi:hypothetical protein